MDRQSTSRLRLDRRLIGRRRWISKEELEAELASLPDVSHKVAPPEEQSEGTDEPGSPREGQPRR